MSKNLHLKKNSTCFRIFLKVIYFQNNEFVPVSIYKNSSYTPLNDQKHSFMRYFKGKHGIDE